MSTSVVSAPGQTGAVSAPACAPCWRPALTGMHALFFHALKKKWRQTLFTSGACTRQKQRPCAPALLHNGAVAAAVQQVETFVRLSSLPRHVCSPRGNFFVMSVPVFVGAAPGLVPVHVWRDTHAAVPAGGDAFEGSAASIFRQDFELCRPRCLSGGSCHYTVSLYNYYNNYYCCSFTTKQLLTLLCCLLACPPHGCLGPDGRRRSLLPG